MMRILLTGLTTLQWGRLEFGNIGNYYIIVPLFRQLRKAFPDAEIATTLQLSQEFLKRESLIGLPLESYYAWQDNDLDSALKDLSIATIFHETGHIITPTLFIEQVVQSDLVVFFHGDMWGDNSMTMGKDRFLVDLLRSRTAQLLRKPVVMYGSSPGPVNDIRLIEFAKLVYNDFSFVINRERYSKPLLQSAGFDVSKTVDYACPAFLFDETYYPESIDIDSLCQAEGFTNHKRANIGIILATYSLAGNSYDSWDWDNDELIEYAKLIEYIVGVKRERVVLISHSNGFELPPDFERIHWRDYKLLCKLFELLRERKLVDMSYVHKIDNLYHPWEMHALIGKLDLLISGRVHGAVAGLEQNVPTLAIDYKNGPLAHKMLGFFDLVGLEKYVIAREDFDFIGHFEELYENADRIAEHLGIRIPLVRERVIEGINAIKSVL